MEIKQIRCIDIKQIIQKVEQRFDQKKAEAHIQKLLSFYKIEVIKWSAGSNGRAYPLHKIKIPKPTDTDRFCVCMHEIKHIIDGIKGKGYIREYQCEKFALEQAELLGFDTTLAAERARRYVILNVASAHCRKLNLSKIPKEISDFCNQDFTQWEGKRVYVSGWGRDVYKGLPLVIEFQENSGIHKYFDPDTVKANAKEAAEEELKSNARFLLDQINSPVGGSPIEFILAEKQTPTLITFQAKFRQNLFINNHSILNGFSDYYYDTLKRIFDNNGYEVSFNNTGSTFWINKIKK